MGRFQRPPKDRKIALWLATNGLFTIFSVDWFWLPIFPTNLVRGLWNKEMKFQNKGAVPVQIAPWLISQPRNQNQSIGCYNSRRKSDFKYLDLQIYQFSWWIFWVPGTPVYSRENLMNESCHTYGWVMSHIWMNESCLHIRMSRVTHMNESCHTYAWVVSHIWMSHVTHMNEWVMSHIWMSHVTHMNESCHT